MKIIIATKRHLSKKRVYSEASPYPQKYQHVGRCYGELGSEPEDTWDFPGSGNHIV